MSHPRGGRPEAALAIWDWRNEAVHASPGPSPARARWRGVLQALIGATVGGLIFALLSRTAGYVVLTVAGFIATAALLSPLGLFAAIERAFLSLGNALGRGISWILLPLVFYVFFLPFGRMFRRGRRDSMKRFYDPEAPTYWTTRDPERSLSASRRRQF